MFETIDAIDFLDAGDAVSCSVRLSYSYLGKLAYESGGGHRVVLSAQSMTDTASAQLSNRFNLSSTNTITACIDWQKRRGNIVSSDENSNDTEQSETIGLLAQARLEPTDRRFHG